MKVPPDQTAELRAASLLSVGGTAKQNTAGKLWVFLKAESVSVKTILASGTLPSYCDKPLLIHIAAAITANKLSASGIPIFSKGFLNLLRHFIPAS